MKFPRTARLLRRLANWLSPIEYDKSVYSSASLESNQQFDNPYYDEDEGDPAVSEAYKAKIIAKRDRIVEFLRKENELKVEGIKNEGIKNEKKGIVNISSGLEDITEYLPNDIPSDLSSAIDLDSNEKIEQILKERRTEKGDYSDFVIPADPGLGTAVLYEKRKNKEKEFEEKAKLHDELKQDAPLESSEVYNDDKKPHVNYPPPKPWPKAGLPPEVKYVPGNELEKGNKYKSDLSDHPVVLSQPKENVQEYVDGAISYVNIPQKKIESGHKTPALGTPLFGPYSIEHTELDDAIKKEEIEIKTTKQELLVNQNREIKADLIKQKEEDVNFLKETKEDRLESLISREDLNEEEQKELQSLIGGREVIILRDAIVMEDG